MATANPDRVPLNLMINLKTRADLEYLARQHDSELAEEVRMAIHWRAYIERLLETGAMLIVRFGKEEFFLMTPGYSGPRAFSRAEHLIQPLTDNS